MAKRKKKKLNYQEEIAKWAAIGAWSIPATPIAKTIYLIIKHLLKK